MRTDTDHQFCGHAVDGDRVLVLSRLVVTFIGDYDESSGALISKENCSHYARFCAVSAGLGHVIAANIVRVYVGTTPLVNSLHSK